jgi:hypothetical protein
VFSKPAIKELLSQYVLVKLYTDEIPAAYQNTPGVTDAGENRQFQVDRFGTVELPLYVILRPDGKGDFQEVGRYAVGVIHPPNVNEFAEFLRKPLTAAGGTGVAQANVK